MDMSVSPAMDIQMAMCMELFEWSAEVECRAGRPKRGHLKEWLETTEHSSGILRLSTTDPRHLSD
eukprot:9497895-Alexandrium_andersonii.AAC.1